MSKPTPTAYRRPMTAWWRRNPYFMRYMARELTALVVAAYALFLLAGLVCLARGEQAYESWHALLTTPWMVLLQVVALLGMVYHSWTWFEIMPKTMPPIIVNGKRLAPGTIIWSGVAAACASTLVLLLIIGSLMP